MKRGDVVLVAVPGDYGKPRPVVVIQTDLANETHASFVVCPMTSYIQDAPLFRLDVVPTAENGLKKPSQVMVDKIVAVRREKVRQVIRSQPTHKKNQFQANRCAAPAFGR